LFVLPVGFSVHYFMVARAAYNMICRLFFGSTAGLRTIRDFRSDTCSCRNAGERHDLATDPEQTMSSLSPASR